MHLLFSSVVLDSVDHSAFVASLIVVLVSVKHIRLQFFGTSLMRVELGPNVDWHQLLGLEVGRLQASAHR